MKSYSYFIYVRLNNELGIILILEKAFGSFLCCGYGVISFHHKRKKGKFGLRSFHIIEIHFFAEHSGMNKTGLVIDFRLAALPKTGSRNI